MKILTQRKQAWVDRRRPKLVQGNPINPNVAVEIRYYQELQKYIDFMTSEVDREIKELFKSETADKYYAMDDTISSQARILTNALLKRFTSKFTKIAKPLAERFANGVDGASSKQVHNSLQKLSGGLSLSTANLDGQLKEMLSATITENVSLITSIPERYLKQVQGAVMRSITTGNGLQDLVPFLAKQKDITLRKAQLMALDQNRKAMNGLSRARMQNLGLKKFKWLHTGGSNEPRRLHQDMSGNIYSFDDPPVIDEVTGEKGFPGQAINCRCRMLPVIEFQEEN